MKNHSSIKPVIHQFTPSMAVGDSVSNSLLYIQKMLLALGYDSNIYVARNDLDLHLKHDIYHIDEYIQNRNHILFYHHSIGHAKHDEIMSFSDQKIMVYHNITPPHFFKHNKYIQDLCNLGRKQLATSSRHFIASIADSNYNLKELLSYNYLNAKVLTLLVDLNAHLNYDFNQKLIDSFKNFYNIIFVGRVVQNKPQHQLVDVAFFLKQNGIEDFKIHIIGGASDEGYMQNLRLYVENLDLKENVNITSKVSNEDLASYYSLANLYLCVSEHEGFGMPLVEAMRYEIPVLTYNCGGVSDAVAKESLLMFKAPSRIARRIIEIKNNPDLVKNLIQKQNEKLSFFSYENTLFRLKNFLNEIWSR